MTTTPQIQVHVGTQGVPQAIAALHALRNAAMAAGGHFGNVGRSMSDAVNRIRSAGVALGGVGIAAAGIAGTSFGGLLAGLEHAKTLAQEVSEELNALDRAARGTGTSDAATFGGLGFAFELAGMGAGEGVAEAEAIGGALVATLREVKAENVDMLGLFENLGAYYEDFFDTESGNILGFDKIFANLATRIKDLNGQQNVLEALSPLIGEADSAKLVRLLEQGGDAINQQIDLYRALTGIRDGDVEAAKAYAASLRTNEAAAKGLRVAFTRDLFPTLIENDKLFQDFAVRNQSNVQAFGGVVAQLMSRLQPLLLQTAETVLVIASGNGGDLADSPLKSFIEGLIQYAFQLADAIEDILQYLQTGETDVPWLRSSVELFQSAFEASKDFFEAMRDDVIPFVRRTISGVSELLSMLGIDGTGQQLGVVVGLVAFGNVLATVVTSVTALVTAIAAIPGVAAAAAAALPALGAGFIITDAESLKKQTAIAADQAKKLEEERGEAFAAAYLRSFIDHIPQEFATDALVTGLQDKLSNLDVKISEGDPQDAIDGTLAAFRQFGWDVDKNGKVSIGAGLFVDGAEFSGAVYGQLSNLSTDLHISKIVGIEDKINELRGVLELQLTLDGKIRTGNIGAGDFKAAAATDDRIEMLYGELERLRAQRPVVIQLPGGQAVDGISASQSAVDELSRAVSMSQRTRS